MKTGHRVYFHITILMNRSVQLVARNHECPKELNNVPCVIWSCIKMHATHKIVNYASRLIIRATSCTLRGVNNPPIMLNFGCQPYSLYREDFSVHRLKLFGSIYVAYGLSQTLAGYNKQGYFMRSSLVYVD